MADIKFNCPQCNQSLEAPEDMAGMSLDCPACQKAITIPPNFLQGKPRLQLRSVGIPTKKDVPMETPAVTDPYKARSANKQESLDSNLGGVTVALTCKNCGGQMKCSSSSDVAVCLFCGSEHLIKEDYTKLGKLRDQNGGGFNIVHYQPLVNLSQIRGMIEEIALKDPSGDKRIRTVKMSIQGMYLPVWEFHLQVHCSWQGYYLEKRTVIKYKSVWKNTGRKVQNVSGEWRDEMAQVQEPYNDTEEITHPQSGTYDYVDHLWYSASPQVTDEQLDMLMRGFDQTSSTSGEPRPTGDYVVINPSLSENGSWERYGGDAYVVKRAPDHCRGCSQYIKKAHPAIMSKTTSFSYFPLAVVTYSIDGMDYRHLVNMLTGEFRGDVPVDMREILREVIAVKESREKIRSINSLLGVGNVIWIVLAVIITIAVGYTAFELDEWNDPTFGWWLKVVGCIVIVVVGSVGILSFREEDPWPAFVLKRSALFLRLFLNPPPHYRQAMYAGFESKNLESVMEPLKYALDNNFSNIIDDPFGLHPDQYNVGWMMQFTLRAAEVFAVKQR